VSTRGPRTPARTGPPPNRRRGPCRASGCLAARGGRRPPPPGGGPPGVLVGALLIACNKLSSPMTCMSVCRCGWERGLCDLMHRAPMEYLARGAPARVVHSPIRYGGGLIRGGNTSQDRQPSLLSGPINPLEIRWPLQPKLPIFAFFYPVNPLEFR
jgi:hypothetical protein